MLKTAGGLADDTNTGVQCARLPPPGDHTASGKPCRTARQHGQKPLTQRLLRLIGPGASMRVTCSELQEENQEEVMSYKQRALLKTILDLK